jgi:hypothetical protein
LPSKDEASTNGEYSPHVPKEYKKEQAKEIVGEGSYCGQKKVKRFRPWSLGKVARHTSKDIAKCPLEKGCGEKESRCPGKISANELKDRCGKLEKGRPKVKGEHPPPQKKVLVKKRTLKAIELSQGVYGLLKGIRVHRSSAPGLELVDDFEHWVFGSKTGDEEDCSNSTEYYQSPLE